jgi:hypothetical protein
VLNEEKRRNEVEAEVMKRKHVNREKRGLIFISRS